MTLPVRIVVRTRTAWETMTINEYVKQDNHLTPKEFVRMGRDVLPSWEAATGLNYYRYRAEVRRLCEERLRSLGLPLTIGFERIDWESEDEALVLVDDDDIILPSIASIAERFTDDVNVVIWRHIVHEFGRWHEPDPPYNGLETCNAAIRKSFIKRLRSDLRDDALLRHWHAAAHLKVLLEGDTRPKTLVEKAIRMTKSGVKGFEHPSVIRIKETHSVYCLHSASISFLSYKMAKTDDPVSAIRALPLHPVYEAANVSG